jgi:hypothetical protein
VRRRRSRSALLALGLALATPAVAAAQGSWRLEQPPPPPGAVFKVPLGAPGDLKCSARNRCLLGVEGNAAIPRGLFIWNGQSWRQYSTVCGGLAETMRIAWAGPAEFWTVSEPSRPRIGNGTALCHFSGGSVVGSFSTEEQSSDPYRRMNAATCVAPDNCWFGGIGSQDPTGERVGAFHLRWDGAALVTVYNQNKGRAVSDVEPHAGGLFESVLVGPAPESFAQADVSPPETPGPRLLHRIGAAPDGTPRFDDDGFLAPDGTELLALDGDGSQLWAVGAGAASGPEAQAAGGMVPHEPLVARFESGAWREIDLPDGLLADDERLVDVAAVPGTNTAWAAVQRFSERRSTNVKAKVVRIEADGDAEVVGLPASGSGRGSAARIEFTAENDGWLATQGGWLFHYTDGTSPPVDTEPGLAGTVTFRPNEAAEQFIPDTLPPDDSQLFAPPLPEAPEEPERRRTRRRPALIRKVKTKVTGLTLTVSFTLTRRARVGLVARRGGTVVARAKTRPLRPGRRVLRLRLDPSRWPTRLVFVTREARRR